MATVEAICTVFSVGASTDQGSPPNSIVWIALSDTAGSFAREAFTAVDQAKREMLATALAAVSNKAKVLAIVDDPNSPSIDPSIGVYWCYQLILTAP